LLLLRLPPSAQPQPQSPHRHPPASHTAPFATSGAFDDLRRRDYYHAKPRRGDACAAGKVGCGARADFAEGCCQLLAAMRLSSSKPLPLPALAAAAARAPQPQEQAFNADVSAASLQASNLAAASSRQQGRGSSDILAPRAG
jgi:hypothetical protein